MSKLGIMPVKICVRCENVFWARWGNTPAVCGDCAQHVVICPGCWRVTTSSDPAQLPLFDVDAALAACSAWRPLSVLVGEHFANRVPRGFDWESYAEHLLTTRRAANLELQDVAPWPKPASRRERMQYPYH